MLILDLEAMMAGRKKTSIRVHQATLLLKCKRHSNNKSWNSNFPIFNCLLLEKENTWARNKKKIKIKVIHLYIGSYYNLQELTSSLSMFSLYSCKSFMLLQIEASWSNSLSSLHSYCAFWMCFSFFTDCLCKRTFIILISSCKVRLDCCLHINICFWNWR